MRNMEYAHLKSESRSRLWLCKCLIAKFVGVSTSSGFARDRKLARYSKMHQRQCRQVNQDFVVAASDFSEMMVVFFFGMTASCPVIRLPSARSTFAPRASLERSSALRGVGTNRWSWRRLFSSLSRPSVRCFISAMPVSAEELEVEKDGEAE